MEWLENTKIGFANVLVIKANNGEGFIKNDRRGRV